MNWQGINIDYKFYRIKNIGAYYVKVRRVKFKNEQKIASL